MSSVEVCVCELSWRVRELSWCVLSWTVGDVSEMACVSELSEDFVCVDLECVCV